jgi:hypothetical protein
VVAHGCQAQGKSVLCRATFNTLALRPSPSPPQPHSHPSYTVATASAILRATGPQRSLTAGDIEGDDISSTPCSRVLTVVTFGLGWVYT